MAKGKRRAVTRRLDLRTGRPIWMARRPAPVLATPLERAVRCDALVIGGGISGALIADALSEAGLGVIAVDRRGPLRGSTPASTALLQYEIDVPLHRLAARIGRGRAERFWRRSRLGLAALHERARRLGIAECADLVERDSLYLQGELLDRADLEREAEARRRAGFEVCFLAAAEVRRLYGIAGRAAIRGHGNLCADPLRLAAGFWGAAVARGTRLHAPVDVVEVETHGRFVEVRTASAARIRAHFVVFASGYEMLRGVPRKGHEIASTWCIATRPQPRRLWPGHAMMWEAADPYLYVRVGPRGEVICGGEDEEFEDERQRDALLPRKRAILERKLSRLLPQVDSRAAHAWCGSFGTSRTGTPTIGAVPRMPGCFAALGYGGNGITYSMIAAQLIRGLIVGKGDPDSDLMSFSRSF